MLFKIIATHNYETCTAHNEETKQNFVKTMMTAVLYYKSINRSIYESYY